MILRVVSLKVVFVFSCIILTCFTFNKANADGLYQIEGRIVYESSSRKKIDGYLYERYRLRIQQKSTSSNNVPKLFTAYMLVEPGSFEQAIIKRAIKRNTSCSFSISQKGMAYKIHQIFLLEGGRFSSSPNLGGFNGNQSQRSTYYDSDNNVLIQNSIEKKNGVVIGNEGILIGGN